MAEPMIVVEPEGIWTSRCYTNSLYAAIEEGLLDPSEVLQELLGWLSEEEVKTFLLKSLYFRDEDNEPIIRELPRQVEEEEEDEE